MGDFGDLGVSGETNAGGQEALLALGVWGAGGNEDANDKLGQESSQAVAGRESRRQGMSQGSSGGRNGEVSVA